MTGQEVLALVKKHGSVNKAAKAAGVAKSTFQEWVKKAQRGDDMGAGEATAKAHNHPTPGAGKSLSDFRAAYDKGFIIPRKIKDALRQLGNGWEYEVQFAKLAGVSLADLGNFRDQFADHVVPLKRDGKRAWAGTASTAKAMKEML